MMFLFSVSDIAFIHLSLTTVWNNSPNGFTQLHLQKMITGNTISLFFFYRITFLLQCASISLLSACLCYPIVQLFPHKLFTLIYSRLNPAHLMLSLMELLL